MVEKLMNHLVTAPQGPLFCSCLLAHLLKFHNHLAGAGPAVQKAHTTFKPRGTRHLLTGS